MNTINNIGKKKNKNVCNSGVPFEEIGTYNLKNPHTLN
jgi:hypothetical protein